MATWINNRKREIGWCLVGLLCLTAAVVRAGESEARLTDQQVMNQLVGTALADRKGMTWLRELCRDGGRITGSENLAVAIRWAVITMKEAGFQRVWTQPVQVPNWKRGIERAWFQTGKGGPKIDLSVAALGRSVGTPEGGVTAPLVILNDLTEATAAGERLKGAIVLYNQPFDETRLNTFASYGAVVKNRLFGADVAARQGAVAVLVRSITTRRDNVPHVGTMVYLDNAPRIPAAAISWTDADRLAAAATSQDGIQVHLEMTCHQEPDITSANVIGELTGSTFPDQVIVLGAHIDAWDKGQGAHDDGAGCIHAMEALDLLRRCGLKPKRTIRCVLFVSEEYGSHGARAYDDWEKHQQEQLLAAIESDRGGFTPRGLNVDVKDEAVLGAVQEWAPILRSAAVDWVRKGGSGADVEKLTTCRAPMGLVVDSQRYFDVHHSENDVRTRVHPRELELGSAAMAGWAWLISEHGLPMQSAPGPAHLVE